LGAEEEARLIRYLLDDAPHGEGERIEERYFVDDLYYESLAAFETQLVRDWLIGVLPRKHASKVEFWVQHDNVLREHATLVKALAGLWQERIH
jgi:hypothetical protein